MKVASLLLALAVLSAALLGNPSLALQPARTRAAYLAFDHYHNYSEIEAFLLEINSTFSDLVNVYEVGETWQGRSIYAVELTDESASGPKAEVLFVGAHHAREPISDEVVLYFLQYVLNNYDANATIQEMLAKCRIVLVPVLNPDGIEIALYQNDAQRKNARPVDEDGDGLVDEDPPEDIDGDGYISEVYDLNHNFLGWEGIDNDGDGLLGEDWIGGVDLNRNYEYMWSEGSNNTRSEVYRGPAPFSEPETRAMRDVVLKYNFSYAISFHSGIYYILYPWSSSDRPTFHQHIFAEVANAISEMTGVPAGQASTSLYYCYGEWMDWCYSNKSIIALTIEVYGNRDAFQSKVVNGTYIFEYGYFDYFNPPADGIVDICELWLPAMFYVVQRAIAEFYDSVPPQVAISTPENGTVYEVTTSLDEVEVSVSWSGSDDLELDRYEVYVDGELAAVKPVSDVSYQTTLGLGEHEVAVKAVDRGGNEAWSKVEIVVALKNYTVAVRIVDQQTSEPVANARVEVYDYHMTQLLQEGYTNSSGFFVAELPYGIYRVKVSAPGYQEEVFVLQVYSDKVVTLELKPPSTAPLSELSLVGAVLLATLLARARGRRCKSKS